MLSPLHQLQYRRRFRGSLHRQNQDYFVGNMHLQQHKQQCRYNLREEHPLQRQRQYLDSERIVICKTFVYPLFNLYYLYIVIRLICQALFYAVELQSLGHYCFL